MDRSALAFLARHDTFSNCEEWHQYGHVFVSVHDYENLTNEAAAVAARYADAWHTLVTQRVVLADSLLAVIVFLAA